MDEGTILSYPAFETLDALVLVIACSLIAFVFLPVICSGVIRSDDATVPHLDERIVSAAAACCVSAALLVWTGRRRPERN